MKKTRMKRESKDSGLGSAVLDAPEDSFARKGAAVAYSGEGWLGRGPAPAGALQRGYGAAAADAGYTDHGEPEEEYLPRRGSLRLRLGGIPKSVGGRIVLGVVVFSALSAVAVALGVARYYALHDDRFLMASSTDIQIVGDEHLSRPQVLGVFAGDLQRNIFRVPLAQRKADLERLPWVEHATVMRLLPNRLRVQITERTPVAFVRQGTQIGLVDAGGVLLDMPPEAAGDPKYSFPVLTGVSPNDDGATRAARMEVYRQFVRELDGTGEKLTNSLSEVDVSDPEDVKALVTSGSSDILVHFGDEAFLTRYREFEQHVPEWKQQYPKLASADMRYEGQIVLEMQSGAGVPVNGETGAAIVAAAETKPALVAPAMEKPVAKAEKPKAPAVKTVAKAAPEKAASVKPSARPEAVDLGVAAPATKAVAVPVTLKPGGPKAAVVSQPVAKKPVAKKAVAKPAGKAAAKSAKAAVKSTGKSTGKSTKGKAGKSASNEKMFAALAAARKANTAKGGATP